MNVTTCQVSDNSIVCHSVNSRDQLADPYRTRVVSIRVLEWSLNDRNTFALIIPREYQRYEWGNPECKNCLSSSIFFDKPHSSFTPTWVSVDFCPSNDIFYINKNIRTLMLGLQCTERKPYTVKPVYYDHLYMMKFINCDLSSNVL